MKKTGTLQVITSTHIQSGHFVLHPNEGFDLGMMKVSYPVQLCTHLELNDFLQGAAGERVEVHVDLMNECPHSTIQMSQQLWKHVGMPPKAVVLYDGERLYLQPIL